MAAFPNRLRFEMIDDRTTLVLVLTMIHDSSAMFDPEEYEVLATAAERVNHPELFPRGNDGTKA